MALILSLKERQDFFVGKHRFTLTKINGPTSFCLKSEAPDDKGRTITDERGTEVMPDVFVSAGESHQSNMASVVITAPKEILILRGDLHRADAARKDPWVCP